MSLFGVDVSSVQGVTAPVGVDFAYIRVRRSNGAQDTAWLSHYDALEGKQRAPYIFVRPPSVESFGSQISSFLSMCGWTTSMVWEWGPVFDCEWTGLQGYSGPAMTAAEIAQVVAAYRTAVNNAQAVCYVYLGHQDASMAAQFAGDPNIRTIGARYYANNRTAAWGNFGATMPNQDVVQYWNAGSVQGVSGNVDLNDARNPLLGGNADVTTLDDTYQPTDPASGKPVGNPVSYAYMLSQIYQGLYYGGTSTANTSLFGHVDAVPAATAALTQAQINNVDTLLNTKIDGLQASVNGETDKDKGDVIAAIQAIPSGTVSPSVYTAVQALLAAMATASAPAAPTA